MISRSLELAQTAEATGEVPVGALITLENRIIGEGYNAPIRNNDPTAHAEIVAIRQAASTLNNYRLTGSTLYVSLEPCMMCAGAILHSRIQRVVFAARDERFGAAGSIANLLDSPLQSHRCQVTAGVMQERSEELLKTFFRTKR